MVSTGFLAFTASTLLSLASAMPASLNERQTTFVPGTLNNTQEFYIKMSVTCGDPTYDGYRMITYHTGAGLADPVFYPSASTASPAYLNGTHLQFDVNQYAFSLSGFPSDTNYARWEPVTINAGYGSGSWAIDAEKGIVETDEEFGGWVVCEWYHGDNLPQLFEFVKGFAGDTSNIPSSCAQVNLIPEYI